MTDATPETLPDALHESLVVFTGCIGEALDVCSYGLTIGESYVPFDPDPEDDCDEQDTMCSQAWVRVNDVSVVGLSDSWQGDCGGQFQLTLEVGVLRCVEIPDGGEAPTASDVLVSALQAMSDMKAMYCAAMGCEEAGWDSISVGQWIPNGPQGGQVGGVWSFTVVT